MANKWVVAPRNVAVVEENILAFATVVAAVHFLHVGFGCIRVGILMAVDAIITIGGNRVVLRGSRRVSVFSTTNGVATVVWILVCEGITEVATQRRRVAEIGTVHWVGAAEVVYFLRAGGADKNAKG